MTDDFLSSNNMPSPITVADIKKQYWPSWLLLILTDSQDAQDAPADLWIDGDEADLAAGLWPYAEQHESQWHVLSSCTMSLQTSSQTIFITIVHAGS